MTRLYKPLFYIALILELIFMLIEKSEFSFEYDSYAFRVSFVFALAALFCLKHSKKEWVLIVVTFIFTAICYKITGRNELMRVAAFVMAARDIDLGKAMKITFYVAAAGAATIVLLAALGIMGDMYLVRDFGRGNANELRYVFGFGHPNTLFSSIYALILMWIWLYGSKAKKYAYIIVAAVCAGLCFFTKSRTGMLILFMTLAAAVAVRLLPTLRFKKTIYALTAAISPVICVLLSVLAAWAAGSTYIKPGRAFELYYWKIEELINYRMSNLYYESFEHGAVLYNWKLFSSPTAESYFDMGWVRLYYWYGIIPATLIVLLIIFFVYLCWKNKDIWSLVIVLSLGVYTIIEATFVSRYIGRNFFLLIFAVYLGNFVKKGFSDR